MGAAALLACLSLRAQAQAPTTGYQPANDQGCRVWVPPQLHGPDFIPHYSGACKDGFAQGKGQLEWVNRFASMRVTAVWTGYFAQGIYIGTVPIDYHIEPQSRSNEYIVHDGSVTGGEVLVFAANGRDGTMELCAASILGVVLNDKTPATADDAVKKAMTDAVARLGSQCQSTPRSSIQINAYAGSFAIDAHGQRTPAVAYARWDWERRELSGYDNQASAQVRNQRLSADRAQALLAQRHRFEQFSERNAVTSWVTAAQLAANPFKYEGHHVGLVVRLDRMLTRDTALVDGALDGDGGAVQLHGIDPGFPDTSVSVLLAVQVGEREPLTGDAGGNAVITSVKRLEVAPCAEPDCTDWLAWSRGEDRIEWGAPYRPAQ